MQRVIARIKKRDGDVVDFVKEKITNAIFKAMESSGLNDQRAAESVSDIVTFMLEEKFGGYTVPSVEQIQDTVEMVLMKQGYHEVAKSYILYREKHKGIREARRTGINLERLVKLWLESCPLAARGSWSVSTPSFRPASVPIPIPRCSGGCERSPVAPVSSSSPN